jgi:hypothetical protein
MKVQEEKLRREKVQEHSAISELTERQLDAVNGGFLGRLLASDKEAYLTFEMSKLMVSSY